jgi:hypothetical protein
MDSPTQTESSQRLSIAVVHGHRLTRDVIAKTLANKLDADAVAFGCLEDLLHSSMRYDVFVVFSEFGPGKMEQSYGCKWIRDLKPHAQVFAMLQRRHFERRGTPPASDRVSFCVADDLNGLAIQIRRRIEEAAAQPVVA